MTGDEQQPTTTDREDADRQAADREEADRQAEESDRRQWLHDLERHAAHQPQQPGPERPDPIHVLKVRFHDTPSRASYYLARWSLVARLRRDAEASGDQLTNLGAHAMAVARAAQNGDFPMGVMLHVGIAAGRRWVRWCLPGVPVEPVPVEEQP